MHLGKGELRATEAAVVVAMLMIGIAEPVEGDDGNMSLWKREVRVGVDTCAKLSDAIQVLTHAGTVREANGP